MHATQPHRRILSIALETENVIPARQHIVTELKASQSANKRAESVTAGVRGAMYEVGSVWYHIVSS